MNDKEKELIKKVEETKKKEVERQVGYLKNNLQDNLKKISPEETLLIKKGGSKDFFFLDIYLIKDNRPIYLGRWPCDADTTYHRDHSRIMSTLGDDEDIGPYKFLQEEEIEIIDEDDQSALKHQTWKIDRKEDFKAFRGLICNPRFREIYSKRGWKGLRREIRDDLRARLGDVYPDVSDFELFEKRDNFRDPISSFGICKRLGSKIINYPLDQKIIKYALDSNDDLTVKEAITALKLDDQKFAEAYEKRKNLIQNKLNDLEGAFGHYLNKKGEEGG